VRVSIAMKPKKLVLGDATAVARHFIELSAFVLLNHIESTPNGSSSAASTSRRPKKC